MPDRTAIWRPSTMAAVAEFDGLALPSRQSALRSVLGEIIINSRIFCS